jgi:hypothetical protein
MRVMIAVRASLIVGFALASACKSRGTIAISFTRDPNAEACLMPATHSQLYAEPNLSCSACACGACFGASPHGVDGCPDGFCDAMPSNVDLDLGPGHWVVVLELLDDAGTELGSSCVEIDVDRDGVSSSPPVTGTIACDSSCGMP